MLAELREKDKVRLAIVDFSFILECITLLTGCWFIYLFIDYNVPTMAAVCIVAVSKLTSVFHVL